MTWSEWINSSYNTDGFYVNEDGLAVDANGGRINDPETYYEVELSDVIIANGEYFCRGSE